MRCPMSLCFGREGVMRRPLCAHAGRGPHVLSIVHQKTSVCCVIVAPGALHKARKAQFEKDYYTCQGAPHAPWNRMIAEGVASATASPTELPYELRLPKGND